LKPIFAKQRGGRHVARAAERQDGEGQRDQQPEQRGQRQRAGIEAAAGRHRQQIGQGPQRRRASARPDEADEDGDGRDRQDLAR
jgi:hypothetical protein